MKAPRIIRDIQAIRKAVEEAPKQATLKHRNRSFIVSTEGEVSPLSALVSTHIEKRDQQQESDDSWLKGDGLMERPYPAESFYAMYESNTMVWRCCRQIATDVAGLGWTLNVRESMSENEAERKKIMELLEHPNPDMSFRRINEAFVIDVEVSGCGALQVVRSKNDEVYEVWHMPSGHIWVYKDGSKFCQNRYLKKTWFAQYRAGTKDGKKQERLSLNPETGEAASGDISELANELIWYFSYYPGSRWYGVPSMLPCTGEILTGLGIRDFNLAFFGNHGIPAYIVKMEGPWDVGSELEEGEDDSMKIVEDYMKALRSPAKAHSTLVLDVPDGCKLEVEPLAVKVEEGSFKVLKQMVDQDVLTAYSMPPYRIGIAVRAGSLAGNIAGELTTNYINGVVEPRQSDLEAIWSDQIFRDGLNCPSYELKFKNLDIRDEAIEHKEDDERVSNGTMSRNEYRIKRGEEAIPGLDSFTIPATVITIGEEDLE